MRLWHKDLIAVLPKQQLLGQWRECCCIARNIKVNGTPNHLLVNKIMDYPIEHFCTYTDTVISVMLGRGYTVSQGSFWKWFDEPIYKLCNVPDDELFHDWHNDRYFNQCYYNLQEKYDCGGITEAEWDKINDPCKGCKFDGLDPIDETGSAIPCISCEDGSKFERR